VGADLIGVKPDEPVGEYFRVDARGWPRFWDFIIFFCDEILTEKDMLRGAFNDGYRISKKKALAIATKIEEVASDRVQYERVLRERGGAFADLEGWSTDDENWPSFRWELAVSFAQFCRHSGGFKVC